jgi:alkanesulfonate monooxygenase SsuD/methylene tetrahydromethanopterin reductase-like flavin-dependent oxidoreductase (luciferase family)
MAGDYGHELAFGAFLTPSSQRPQAVVDLARLADRAGLDLVTFQDHPYQPAFLDTWTLLSYVAAQTQNVRLSGNVLNLPLRHPAVLARSVASLDLLSGGRAELGIGAGGFAQAIEAMGGRRLSPGQGVDALAEAIGVIRQIWDVGARGGVRADGTYYQVSGAKRGPAPAHPISIWVGAYKPRMLRLTGRLADGWLPSLGYIEPGELAGANAIIDEAAAEAGREPGAVRRLLNVTGAFEPSAAGLLRGPAQHWAEQLAELALTAGISTFILGGDDPRAISAFAAEVAPAVRELVAAERAGAAAAPGTGGAGRTAVTLTGGAPGQPGRPEAAQVEAAESAGELGVVPTPDDGTRLSGKRLWDETARPTRPAPRPAAPPYTPAGRRVSAELVAVHDMLREELAGVRDLIL